jgi:hypothetical protein
MNKRGKAPGKPAREAVERKPRKRSVKASHESRQRTLASAASVVLTVVVELVRLVRDMVAIPVHLWLAIAEPAGAVVLAAWRRIIRPLLVAAWRLLAAAVRGAQRWLTPKRAVLIVAVAALVALAASQWVDYRSVSVGNDAYSGGVEAVAPAPAVDVERAGDAHGWLMIPLAVAGLLLVGLAATGRRRAGLGLVLVGAAAIAVSLLIDLPKGLDEGQAALAYEGAKASLLEGFWIQIVAGAALIGIGLLLVAYARPERARAAAPREKRRRRPRRLGGVVKRKRGRRVGRPAAGSSP